MSSQDKATQAATGAGEKPIPSAADIIASVPAAIVQSVDAPRVTIVEYLVALLVGAGINPPARGVFDTNFALPTTAAFRAALCDIFGVRNKSSIKFDEVPTFGAMVDYLCERTAKALGITLAPNSVLEPLFVGDRVKRALEALSGISIVRFNIMEKAVEGGTDSTDAVVDEAIKYLAASLPEHANTLESHMRLVRAHRAAKAQASNN